MYFQLIKFLILWNTTIKTIIMKYRVNRIDVKTDNMQEKLENFINKMEGDLISVIPNVKPTFMMMGATAKINYILVVEN